MDIFLFLFKIMRRDLFQFEKYFFYKVLGVFDGEKKQEKKKMKGFGGGGGDDF